MGNTALVPLPFSDLDINLSLKIGQEDKKVKSSTVCGEIALRIIGLVLGLIIILAANAHCQIMVTGETLGKGKISYFAATNALCVKDFTTLGLSMGQVWYGANNRIDVFGGVSDTAAFGQHQWAMTAGGNINIFKTKAISVSTFHTLSVPMNRRADGSPLWFAAVVASRNIGKVVGYTGYSASVPLGNSADKLFTPASTVHNIPLGVAIPKGKYLVFVEYNYGQRVQTFGIGVSFTP